MAIIEIIIFFFPFVLVLGEIFIPSIILVFADDFQTTPANEHNNERGKRKVADKVAHGTDGCVGCVGGTDLIENQKSENFYRQNNFSLHTPFGFPETASQRMTVVSRLCPIVCTARPKSHSCKPVEFYDY